MNILVDTSVWSLALRKQPKTEIDKLLIKELSELIRELRVLIIGPIRQELLSGISDEKNFKKLQRELRAFDDAELTTEHYELAALYSNECRRHGIQGSHTDFLLCAVSIKNNCPIFTLDKNFDLYKEHIKISLHVARKGV